MSMEKIPQERKDKILDYLDGNLEQAEAQRLQHELERDSALRAQFNDLHMLHTALKQTAPEKPSRNFTQVLIGKLHQYPATSSFPVRNGIILLVGILVAVGIVSLLVSADVFDHSSTTINLNQVNLTEKYIPEMPTSIPFSGKWLVNIIISLNLVLAWLILDKVILRPYFQKRMRAHDV